MFRRTCSLLVVALATTFVVSPARASWTEFSLPNLVSPFSPTAMGFLPDGRYVYANQGAYYRQDAFGAASYTAYTNVTPGNNADPSFIAVWDATRALAGGGGFGASDLYRFDPSTLNAPSFAAQGLALQNYSGVFRDATTLYLAGNNGTGSSHAIGYVDLATDSFKVIIDNVSTYSSDFARDAAGNLYVGDNDDGKVYKFTAAQLALAIGGSALTVADGQFVHQFGNALGSLAVDGLGRIWSAGFLQNGIQVYDPGTDAETTIIPGLDNANYKVYAFTADGQDYVGYFNQANPFSGDSAQFFGYQAIPEPGAFLLTLIALFGLAVTHRHRTK